MSITSTKNLLAWGQGFPPQRIRRRSFTSLSRSASDLPPASRPTLPFSPLLLKRLKTRFCPVGIPPPLRGG